MYWETGSLYMWRLAHKLVKEEGYTLLQVEQDKTLHLIKNEGWHYRYLRLHLVDYFWKAELDRDLQGMEQTVERFRRQVRARDMTGLNIYIFVQPPEEEIASTIANKGHVSLSKKGELYSTVFDFSLAELKGSEEGFHKLALSKEILFESLQEPVREESATEYMREIEQYQQKQQEKERSVFFRGKQRLTYLILAVNIVLFSLMELMGGSTNSFTLIDFGAKMNPLIAAGEWWRFITPMFLHIGITHMFFNTIAVYFVGGTVEKIYGSIRFLVIYFLSGIAGVVASFIFSESISAGASGAIFGCLGALLHFGLRHRDLFFRTIGNDILVILGINLAIGFVFPGIDNYAHLGGLLSGFLVAMVVELPDLMRRYGGQRLLAFVVVVSLLVGGGAVGYGQMDLPQKENSYYYVIVAKMMLQEEQYDRGERYLNKAWQAGVQEAEVHYLLAVLLAQKDDMEQARRHLEQALQIDPNYQPAEKMLQQIGTG